MRKTSWVVVAALVVAGLVGMPKTTSNGLPGRAIPIASVDGDPLMELIETELADDDEAGETAVAVAAEPMHVNPVQYPDFRDDAIVFPEARARFFHGAMRYHGQHGGGRQSLSYRLQSVTSGDAKLFDARGTRAPRAVRSGDGMTIDRGAVTEWYRPVDGRLEQGFTIARKPATSGDLVVTGSLKTNLKPMASEAGTIVLGRQGVAEMKIEKAVAIDAKGRHEAIAMAYDAKRRTLSMTVPAAWMAGAAYPVVVDPLYGPVFAVNAGVLHLESNHRHNTSGGQFLSTGTGTTGAWGQFLNSLDGSVAGAPFTVPNVGDDIAYLPSVDQYCVVYTTVSNGDEAVAAYFVSGSGTVAGPSILYTRADTETLTESRTYSFGAATVSAISNGWVIGFNCNVDEDPEDQDDFDFITWSMECIRINASGVLTTPMPLVAGSETFRDYFGSPDYFGTESQDWDVLDPVSAALRDEATSTDRFCLFWYEERDYDPDEDGYSDVGNFRTRVAAAVVNATATPMTIARQWNVQTEEVAYESDSEAACGEPRVCANDVNNEFFLTWESVNPAGYSSVKGRRQNFEGTGAAAEIFIRGAAGQETAQYYNGDVVASTYASSGTGAAILATFTVNGNVYAKEIAGGSNTVPADINIATTTAAESVRSMTIDRGDTHVLILMSTGGQMYEIRSVTTGPEITTTSLPGATQAVAYTTQLAYTGGNSTAAWSVTAGALPGGLALGATTGLITGTPTAAGTFAFTVQLTSGGMSDTQALSIVVAPGNMPVITTSVLPVFLNNVPCQVSLQYSGPTGTDRWTIIDGTLPAGLSMSLGGVISGRGTVNGTKKFTVQVTVNDQSAIKVLKLKVKTTSVTKLVAGKQGIPYANFIPVIGGTGTATVRVIDGTLPPGLTLALDGTLSGTPTAYATYYFTVRCDRGASNYPLSLKLTIKRP